MIILTSFTNIVAQNVAKQHDNENSIHKNPFATTCRKGIFMECYFHLNVECCKIWERWNIQFVTSVAKEKSLSPSQESNPWPPVHRSGALTTELLGDSWWARSYIFTEFVVTRILHTARISNVEGTVCDNKERKMVNFKLGKKRERWNIQFVKSVRDKEKIWVPDGNGTRDLPYTGRAL